MNLLICIHALVQCTNKEHLRNCVSGLQVAVYSHGRQAAEKQTWADRVPTRDNLEVRTNAVIDVGCDDLQAGEGGAELANTLRGRYQAQEQDPALLHPLGQQHLQKAMQTMTLVKWKSKEKSMPWGVSTMP